MAGGGVMDEAISQLLHRAWLVALVRVALFLDAALAQPDTEKTLPKVEIPLKPYLGRNLKSDADRVSLVSETQKPPLRTKYRRQGVRASEAAEFLKLPPQLRRQLLRYGSRWTEALFEEVTDRPQS